MKTVKQHLIEQGHEVVDLGMQSEDKPMMFYEIAAAVSKAIQKGTAERGIMMCGTGNGVCAIANKFKRCSCWLGRVGH